MGQIDIIQSPMQAPKRENFFSSILPPKEFALVNSNLRINQLRGKGTSIHEMGVHIDKKHAEILFQKRSYRI